MKHADVAGSADARMNYNVNGELFSAEPTARTVPAHLPARPRRVRRQEGLRRRRLRRLHGVARRHADAFLPDAGLPRRRARSHHDRGTGEGRARCIRCSRPSRRAGLPVRLLRRRHDHDRRRAQRRAARGPAACAQGQSLPVHRLSLDRRRACRHNCDRGGRRRQGLRRQRPEPVRRRHRHRPGALHDGRGRWRGCCTSRCCARRTPTPASSPSDATRRWRCRAWSRSSPGRTFRAGSTAPRCTRIIWSTPTTPTFSTTSCASSASGSPPSSPRPRPRRERACRLLDVTYEILPAVFDPVAAMEPGAPILHEQGRRGKGQHLCRHPRRGRQRGGRLQGGRRRARDDLFHLARSARPSGDAWLDRLARRRRTAAYPHQLAGAVRRAAEALPYLRPARPRPARLHRAGRRRLRRQAGDGIRGSLPARHAARPAGR